MKVLNYFLLQMFLKIYPNADFQNKTIILDQDKKLCFRQNGRIYVAPIRKINQLFDFFPYKNSKNKELTNDRNDKKEIIVLSFGDKKNNNGDQSSQISKVPNVSVQVTSDVSTTNIPIRFPKNYLKKNPLRIG